MTRIPVVTMTVNGRVVFVSHLDITNEMTSYGSITTTVDVKTTGVDPLGHRANCTIDVGGIIPNVTGAYLYCSCGIMMHVDCSVDPFKVIVAEAMARFRDGSMDMEETIRLRAALMVHLESLQPLYELIDAAVRATARGLISEGGLDPDV